MSAVLRHITRIRLCPPRKLRLSRRMMATDYLVNDQKYSFLQELGLKATNFGVYDGAWRGSGEVSAGIFVDRRLFVGDKSAICFRSTTVERSEP